MLRELGRRLEAQGEQMAARGQWRDAVDRYLDIIELGVDLPRGGALSPAMVGWAIESLGRQPIWGCLNHLSAVEAQGATHRLEKIIAGRVPHSQALLEDRCVSRAIYREVLKENAWHERVMIWLVDRHETDCTKRWISTDKEPYAIRRRKADSPFLKLMEKIPTWWGLGTDFYESVASHAATNEAISAGLAVTLALHGYRLEHGAYPNRLKELVPSYLQHVPRDPFYPRHELRYRRTGGRYLLYSVGPDGKDDRGKPIFDPAKKGRQRYYPEPNSKGDFVAGVNVR
ncbi:MAG: hypothetical protein HY318_00025, partial [Armatimonadetes bacterium]|nr:hypothetical protein [Armatimonadota bacterium]